jgi:ParB family transcriptional regulator, chromosome partitioning protein
MSKQMPQKSRLGRGLSSLMNSTPADVSAASPIVSDTGAAASDVEAAATLPPGVRVLDVPVGDLAPNPHQPRRRFDEGSLKELADSLRSTGMIQPVVARATAEGGYELIAGERRWRAAKIAGLTTLPVILRSVDPVMQAQMALVENLQRTDLNPVERAQAYKALLDNLGLTQAELADRLGEDRSVISHHLRLLDLAPEVQEMLVDGRLSIGHAKVLAGVADPVEQIRLAGLAAREGLNVRNLERLVNAAPAPAQPAAPAGPGKPSSAHLQDLEKSLSRQLGLRVQVRAGKKKGNGRLILHFGSLDQFDDLMSKLGVSTE